MDVAIFQEVNGTDRRLLGWIVLISALALTSPASADDAIDADDAVDVTLSALPNGAAPDGGYEYRRHERLGSILNKVVERFERRSRIIAAASLPTPGVQAAAPDATAAAAEEAASLAPMRLEEQAALVAVTFHIDDPSAVDDVVRFVDENGGSARNRGEDYIEAYVPVPLLAAASARPGVVRVRAIIPPRRERGNVVSQGVQAHKAPGWHALGYTGTGVKVGVIDDGFLEFGQLMGTELPDAVSARCYTSIGVYTDKLSDCERDANHGTAVAESLLDIAPDVDLYIAYPESRGDLLAIVDWMAQEGVRVISMSLSWSYDGPGDGTSPDGASPLNAVDRAVSQGILWVNSAGNTAEKTWYGEFKDANDDGWHEFGNTENRCNMVSRAGALSVLQLRWADRWGGAATDLDIVVFTAGGGEVDRSHEAQRGDPDDVPLESLTMIGGGDFCIAVQRESGPAPAWIQLTTGRELLGTATLHGSMSNPAESANPGMLAVGASNHASTQTIESFSSRGPTVDGRLKPDLVGADNAATVALPQFPGTSQAAPHVAGMAALLLSSQSMTPHELANTLKSNAADRGPGGPDNTWGHGFAEMPSPKTDADLSDIQMFDDASASVALAPSFTPSISRYAATVVAATTQVTLIVTPSPANTHVEITPADADPSNGHQVGLEHGANDIVLTVTGNEGSQRKYRVTVTRGTADADLEALSLSKGRLVPLFSPNTYAYTSRVGDQLSATRTTVTARARSASSTVRITPADVDTSAAAAGHQVALSAGANVIEVQVTAAVGSPSKTYRIDVTRAATPANHAPTAHAGMDQIVGEDETVTLAGGGTDPEGATLSYRWWQTGGVPVRLSSPTARNPTFTAPNLPSQGTLTFALVVNDGAQDSEIADEVVITIRADNVVSFATTSASAPEGGVATLVVTTSRARPTALALRYTLGADGDPATADADAEDYGERVGEATLAAGETRTTIALAIADDDIIEPPRETFAVTLDVAGGNDPIGAKTALVTIEEGVCDRTPQVREALRARTARRGETGVEWNCRSVTGGALAALSSLDLSGRGIEVLRGADLEGLHSLRTLNLGGNRLTALPTGLFEGMAALDELNLSDNPGAPFALVMELARLDAADAAPGPATLEARVAAGAPFPMRARLTAAGAVVSDAKGVVESVAVGLGKSASGTFAAELAAGASLARVALEVDAVPSDECGDYSSHPCFRGVETAAGPALVLFKELPRMVGTEPAGVTLAGVDEYRVPLAPLFTAAAGETLAFEAESDDPTLARVRVANGVLEIAPSLDGREGVATITVVAVDSDGLRATLRFQVTVQFLPVQGHFQGWRLALPAMRIDSGDGN